MNNKFIRIFVFIIGLILFIDGTLLALLGKLNFGTIIPAVIGGFLLIYAIYYQKIRAFLANHPKLKKLWLFGWGLFFVWLISFIFFVTYLAVSISKESKIKSADIVIVLGSGIINNKPTPSLAHRLDKSAEIFSKSNAKMIIVTGGIGFQKTVSEAEVMAEYLHDKFGINKSNIALETTSTSTELNLKNSLPILKAHGYDRHSKIIIVTSDFHTLRAAQIAKKIGFSQFKTASAITPLQTRYNSWFREYFAFGSGLILKEF